jgi:HSP20 family molecular chaperone IbpA
MPKKKIAKKPEPAEEEVVAVVTPEVCIDHDDKGYSIDVQLPGVSKEHIELSVGEQSLCLEAARHDEDIIYLGCYSLAHTVDEDKAKAKFENGLLKIEIPLKSPIKGKVVKIQ